MTRVVHFVESLKNVDPIKFHGHFFVLPDGTLYQAQRGDQLGGIGDLFKKIGAIALPLAGTIAAPFTGGMSLALVGAINAGGAIGAGLLSGMGSGGGGQQAKGLAAINAKGAEVIKAFDALKQKISSEVNFSKADAYSAADKLVAILSDPAEFYQAKNGQDAAALAGFKSQAQQLAPQVKQFADAAETAKQQAAGQQPAGGAIVKTVDANGNIVQTVSNANSLPFGLSATGLVIAGIGIYFLFIRK